MMRGLFSWAVVPFWLMSSWLPQANAESFAAPTFEETDLNGNIQSPEKYAGKPLVIYFWASWCAACRGEVKNMTKVFREFSPKGVGFIAISLDQDLSRLQRFVGDQKIPYPVVFGGEGWETPLARLYEVFQLPTYYLVSPQGIVVDGGNLSDDLRESLKQYVS